MSEWISVKARLPTEEDADPVGCVIVYHLFQGVMVIGWHQIAGGGYYTHWMPTPAPPEEAEKLRAEHSRSLKKRYGYGL